MIPVNQCAKKDCRGELTLMKVCSNVLMKECKKCGASEMILWLNYIGLDLWYER